MAELLDVTLPVFLVMGFGYLAVWRGLFPSGGADAMMTFAQNFAFPCLLFRGIWQFDMQQYFDWPLLISYYTGSITGFGLGLTGAMLIFRRPLTDAIAIGFAAMFANSVMLGLPITERAFGADSLGPNFAIIAIHAPFCYLVGITAMEVARREGRGFAKGVMDVAGSMARNPLMIGIALGFIANLVGLRLPVVATEALDLMIRAALPVALFALGGVLVRYRPDGDLWEVTFIACISLVLHPTIVWLMSAYATDLPRPAMQSAVLTAAMAPGINTYIFANMYGVAKRVAASTVLIGTAVSVLTVSAWLSFIG